VLQNGTPSQISDEELYQAPTEQDEQRTDVLSELALHAVQLTGQTLQVLSVKL
jgi:hypothetical protein